MHISVQTREDEEGGKIYIYIYTYVVASSLFFRSVRRAQRAHRAAAVHGPAGDCVGHVDAGEHESDGRGPQVLGT